MEGKPVCTVAGHQSDIGRFIHQAAATQVCGGAPRGFHVHVFPRDDMSFEAKTEVVDLIQFVEQQHAAPWPWEWHPLIDDDEDEEDEYDHGDGDDGDDGWRIQDDRWRMKDGGWWVFNDDPAITSQPSWKGASLEDILDIKQVQDFPGITHCCLNIVMSSKVCDAVQEDSRWKTRRG